jgi:lysophospholipase L1-like esterase
MSIHRGAWLLAVSCLLSTFAAQCHGDDPPQGPERWEEAIQRFEQSDEEQGVVSGGVLFVGSSSIRRWDLAAMLPEVDALNRGFGGSQMSDVLYYLDRVVLKYRPRVIVLYEGDNDISKGKSPCQVVNEYRRLVRRIHCCLPCTRIVFLSIKPSMARKQLFGKMQIANRQIRAITRCDRRLEFVDVSKVMLDRSGSIRTELFVEDGLHLNEAGYQLWTELVRPHLY